MRKIALAILCILISVCTVNAAGSWSTNGFSYKPQLTTQGTTDYGLFNTSQDRIDARLAREVWVGDTNVAGYTTFAAAVATLNADGGAVTLRMGAGTYAVASNLTVNSNITLRPDNGAVITIATGQTLTVNGSLEAGPYQIFSCTGTGKVVFGFQKVVYPEWYGAVINASGTDCGPALNLAVASLTTGAVPTTGLKGGVVEFQAGTYYIGTQVNLASDVTFKGYGGMGGAATILQRSADITMFSGVGVSILDPAFAQDQILRVNFEGLIFQGQTWGATTYVSDMIDLKACKNFKWSNCGFYNIYGRAVDTWELFDSRFEDCYFNHCGNGDNTLPVMEFKSAGATYERTNNIYFSGCTWESSRYSHIKTTGTTAAYPTSELYFANCKFENNDALVTACAALDFLNCQKVEFVNVSVTTQLYAAMTEVIKFDRCNHIKGRIDAVVTNAGGGSLARVMTIATAAGVWDCHVNLFLSGTSWDLITEDYGINIDSVTQAANINIKSYGATVGYACSTKGLTNFPRQSEAFYGSAVSLTAPTGTDGDWMAIYEHALTAGGTAKWIDIIVEGFATTTADKSFVHVDSAGTQTAKLLLLGVNPTSGTTVMYLSYHNGTGVVVERVTVGAPDSGGAGYKVLRVPN